MRKTGWGIAALVLLLAFLLNQVSYSLPTTTTEASLMITKTIPFVWPRALPRILYADGSRYNCYNYTTDFLKQVNDDHWHSAFGRSVANSNVYHRWIVYKDGETEIWFESQSGLLLDRSVYILIAYDTPCENGMCWHDKGKKYL